MVKGMLVQRNYQQVVKRRLVWGNFRTSGKEFWCKWGFWGVWEDEAWRLMDTVQLAWRSRDMYGPQISSLKHAVSSLPHQAVLGHVSLRGSGCLRTSALVATALCWRADFTSTRNSILASCSFAWTRMLLLKASGVKGAGRWLAALMARGGSWQNLYHFRFIYRSGLVRSCGG